MVTVLKYMKRKRLAVCVACDEVLTYDSSDVVIGKMKDEDGQILKTASVICPDCNRRILVKAALAMR